MQLTRAISFFVCLSLTANPVVAQNSSSSPQAAGGRKIPALYWYDKTGVNQWLKESESVPKYGDGCSLWTSAYGEKYGGKGDYQLIEFVITRKTNK